MARVWVRARVGVRLHYYIFIFNFCSRFCQLLYNSSEKLLANYFRMNYVNINLPLSSSFREEMEGKRYSGFLWSKTLSLRKHRNVATS